MRGGPFRLPELDRCLPGNLWHMILRLASWLILSGAILLDDPTTNLDVHAHPLVLICAHRFTDAGRTVFCVLHDINLAS